MRKHKLSAVARLATTFAILFQQLVGGSLAFAQDGAVVVGGAATISQQGADLNVTTHTDRTVINWDSFNINAGHTANFNQPGVNSAVLNRVVTPNNPSGIYGTLNSNGNVYLVNPSGVIVGPSGVINTNGFTASVLDISNKAFLDGGPLQFSGSSDASIINQGTIHTGNGGVAFIGGQVINEGLIKSDGGSINLLTGGTVQLNAGGTYTQADQETLQNGISQTAGLIRNSGTLRATGALEVGGEVYLVSPGGTVLQEGLIAATKQNNAGGETGGKVVVTGDAVELKSATIDASGTNGGGTVNIGGGFQGGDDSIANSKSTVADADSVITASATDSGDGGTVVLWSDGDTSFEGQIFAQGAPLGSGGLVEVSGKQNLNFAGTVDTGGGQLLLDPFNYIVGATEAGNIVFALNSNNVTILTSANDAGLGSTGNMFDPGDITVNADILWNSEYDLSFLAHRHVNFNANVQNSYDLSGGPGGDVNVVAGWDGVTTDPALFAAADVTSTTLFGNDAGSVFIGSAAQTAGVAVGSAHGTTNVLGHNVTLRGSDTAPAYAQLGFHHVSGGAAGTITTGNINVLATGNISATAGSQSNIVSPSFVQIGHGGFRQDFTSWNYTGDIALAANGNIAFQAGSSGRDIYAQLGNGGLFANGQHTGNHTITQANNITFQAGSSSNSYAQLGNGGQVANGQHTGNHTITQANDIRFLAGSGFSSYAQLGNAGVRATGSHNGNHTITQANHITFEGGSNHTTYAQLGNGGYDTDGSHSGNHTITQANDIRFLDGSSLGVGNYAQLGNGGLFANGQHTGNHTITQANNITFQAGSSSNSYAQLGNGGLFANGSHSGTIDVTAAGNLNVTGQNTTDRYAIIGHGDQPGDGDSGNTVAGDVMLRIGGDATLTNAFLGHQIDNDGTYTSGNTFVGVLGDLSSDAASQFNSARDTNNGELRIYLLSPANDLVDSATKLNAIAHGGTTAPNNQGTFAFGDGPYNVPGTDVLAEFNYYTLSALYNYTVDAAEAAAIVAALGTGGVTLASTLDQPDFGSFYDWDGGTQFIDINAPVAYSANRPFTMAATGPINFNASVQNRNRRGGNLNIVAGWDGVTVSPAAFAAADVTNTTLFGNNNGSVFIGNGSQTTGVAIGSRSGNTNVFGYDVALQGGTGADGRFAQLGFQVTNGMAQDGTDLGAVPVVDGNIRVQTTNNITAIGGSTAFANYVQIGHVGGELTPFNNTVEADASSNIQIAAAGNVRFLGGDGDGAYAQLGQGGGGTVGNHEGTTTINLAQNITFRGGRGVVAYAQLGQGGIEANGNHRGVTVIRRARDVRFTGGRGDGAYAQLGHGGLIADGNHQGRTTIGRVRDITFRGGRGEDAYAQLGQGGLEADGNHTGNTTIRRVRHITFQGGQGVAAYAQLGQGGFFAEGNHDGETTISRVRDIMFSAGSGDRAYAQLGQGGHLADGDHDGTTEITQARDIIFSGGNNTRAYAQLGQGGYNAQGSHMGTTTITLARDIMFTGGSAEITYAQLGNGGDSSDGDHSGDTTITEARDITFTGGQANPDSSYAQLGHGGYDADGTHSGLTTIALARDVTFTGGEARFGYAQLGHGGWDADGQHSGNIAVTMTGNLLLNGQNTRRSYAIIGHGDSPGGTDNGQTVSGNVTLSIGGDATLTNAVIGHQIDAGGIYTGGNTFVAVGNNDLAGTNLTNKLTSDANSSINSAPNANGGELRLYLPRRDSLNMADGATLNGVDVATFPATGPLPNEQGDFTPFNGPYSVDLADGNFAFYFPTIDLIVNANSGSSTYGDTPVDPGLALIDGTLNAGETLGSIGLTNNFNLTATSNAGSYMLSVDDSALDPVYNLVASATGNFTINPAALTITALNLIKPLGTTGIPNGTTDFAATGLKNGETVGSVTLASTGYPAAAGAGVHPIVISNPTGGTFNPANYNISLVNGNLLVAPAGSGISTYDEFIRYIDFFATVQSLLNPTGPPATNNPPTTQSDEENNSPNSAQPENDNSNPQGDEIIIPEIRVTGV